MREIILTKGRVAVVDDDDYDYLNQWKWYAHNGSSKRSKRELFYAARRICLKGKLLLMHNVIMNTPSGSEIDHIDHNGLNNQKENLVICTHKENMQNIKVL